MIDDAIVVLENIYRYIEEKECTPCEAAFAATKEIGLAVLSITLSLVAVFLPIAFMGGIVGRFLKSFGITMAATILVSMIISFSLTPMLAARWLKVKRNRPRAGDGGRQRPAARAAGRRPADSRGGFYAWIEGGYMAILRLLAPPPLGGRALRRGMLASMPTLMKLVRKNFLPDDDQSEFEIKVRAPRARRWRRRSSSWTAFPATCRGSAASSTRSPPWPTATSGSPTRARSTSAWRRLRRRRFGQFENDELRPQRDPAALSQAGPADQRQPGGRLLRRRHDRRPTCSS